LSKLGMLSDLCHDVLCQNASLKNAANKKLDEIEMTPPPFGNTAQLICFILTGGMVTIVFRGSWNDVAIASVGNIWVFFCMTLWPKLVHAQGKVFMYTACSFVPAILATLLSFFVGNVHVTISVVSSVIIPVPGYSISKGIDELINDRITLGASHCIQGLATLTWLALGGYAGKTLVISILTNLNLLEDDSHDYDSTIAPVESVWMALAVPVLCACLAVGLQIAYRDFLPACFCMGMAFVTVYVASFVANANVGTMLAAAGTTVLANGYGRFFDRSKTIVLVPALLLLVSGSIGFRGVFGLLDGERFVGAQQFAQMVVVALVIIVGVFIGNAILPPETTI